MEYMTAVNHTNFRLANKLAHRAEELLQEAGMSLPEARAWITAWVSGAGDGDIESDGA